jgi:tetratricopeptide (TPR) repeat protein
VPWPLRAHHTQINLNRLGVREVRAMVAQVAASKALADDTVATVVERTGGIPLFVEELTRAVLESVNAKLTGREIPVTLHDSLMARLDRLGGAKEVAQVAAVIGREFSYELLHAVHPLAEEDLQSALAKLAEAELVYARGIAPDATYTFKHALIQDAAYEALLKTRRRELHRTVAQTLTEKFAELAEAQPEVLARHWTEAGEIELAIAEWSRAGERAANRHAYREAEQNYRAALAALNMLAESSDRDTRELTLQIALGGLMGATQGWSAADTAEVYASARDLTKRTGAESLEVLGGLYNAALTRDEVRPALALAEQMLEIGGGSVSPQVLVMAHHSQALARHYLGDLAGARQDFLRSIEHYREEDFRGAVYDPGVRSRFFAGNTEWFLGYPDRALRYGNEAVLLARRLNNPADVAFAISARSYHHGLRGEFKLSLEDGEETLRLATASGTPLMSAVGKIRIAEARGHMGEAGRAADSIREVLAEFDAVKFYLARGAFLCELCEVQALAGTIDDAFVTVEQALQNYPDELLYRPEVLRLRGELRRKQGHLQLAEADFRDSIAMARDTGAKAWELRTTMSLARLLKGQGRRKEARAMLADIYNWFTEGFDTADLKDAKALLEELSS